MPTYEVDVGGNTYEVDAPDEKTAWAWAKHTYENRPQKPLTVQSAADFDNRRGPLEYTLDTLGNIPGSAVKFGQDIAQVVRHPIDTLSGALDVGAGALRKGVQKVAPGVAAAIDKLDPNAQAAQRATQAAEAVGGLYGKRYGSFDAAADTLREDPVGVAADVASVLTGAGGAAKLAGKLPKATRAAEIGGKLQKAGSAIDPLQLAIKGGQKVGSSVAAKTAPIFRSDAVNVGQHLRDYFGDRTDPLVQALRNASPNVPGERLTAGKAAATKGFPELKTMEQQARTRDLASKFGEIDEGNIAARQAVLDPIAEPGRRYFDPQTGTTPLSEAEQMRKRVTEPLYKMAEGDRVALTPELDAILNGPEVQGAFNKGDAAFGQQQANAVGGGKTVSNGFENAVTPEQRIPRRYGLQYPDEPFMPVNASYNIQQLQQYKQQLDAVLDAARRQGDAPKVARLSEARRQLASQMEQQSGGYATANTIFKNFSEPVNQANVAEALIEALRRPTGAESHASFLGAMENAPKTLKKADQSPRFQNLGEVMTPDQMEQINKLRQSVASEAAYSNLKAPSNAPPEFLSTAERIEQWLPPMLHQGFALTRRALIRAGSRGGEKARALMDEAMLDPSKLADLLQKTPESERAAIINALRRGGRPLKPYAEGALPYVTPASVLTTPED